jgi:hypothetical protein
MSSVAIGSVCGKVGNVVGSAATSGIGTPVFGRAVRLCGSIGSTDRRANALLFKSPVSLGQLLGLQRESAINTID